MGSGGERRTSMYRSYRVSQKTSMGTLRWRTSGTYVVGFSATDPTMCGNNEEDFCDMTFSGPGAE